MHGPIRVWFRPFMSQSPIRTDTSILEGILTGTTSLVAGIPPRSGDTESPCPDFDVETLTNHLAGFMRRFESVLTLGKASEDSGAYVAGADPAAEYAASAGRMLAAWRTHDPDDEVVLTVGPMPCWQVYCVMLLETTVHGWDLAKATGQALPFTDSQSAAALAASHFVVKPEYRGDGRNFGAEVVVPKGASEIDQLVAFTGREPSWTHSSNKRVKSI
jgi:uncharacterized protein (TIGR03086 family)